MLRFALIVCNTCLSCRSEDLRYEAEKYGPCRDVYCPRDYYTGYGWQDTCLCSCILLQINLYVSYREGRGIGFIEFTNARDAEDAKYSMDRSILDGKEVWHFLHFAASSLLNLIRT